MVDGDVGAAAAAAMASVLDNDDLLRQILAYVDYPTPLICVALVSKRWLRHASDPDFLRRFSARHFGFHSRLLLRRLRQRCVVNEDAAARLRARQEAVDDGGLACGEWPRFDQLKGGGSGGAW